MRSSSPKWMDLSDAQVNPGMARISIVRGTERAGLVCINPQFERFWIMFRLEPGLRSSGPFSPPQGRGNNLGKPRCGAGLFFWGAYEDRGEFHMGRALLAGKNLAKHDDFLAVLFFSLTGLDLSLWLVSRGFFDSIRLG